MVPGGNAFIVLCEFVLTLKRVMVPDGAKRILTLVFRLLLHSCCSILGVVKLLFYWCCPNTFISIGSLLLLQLLYSSSGATQL